MGFIIECSFLEIFYASLLVFLILYLYIIKEYDYWEERKVPHVPATFPFGSVRDIMLGRSFSGFVFDRMYKQFPAERYVGFTDMRVPALLVREPELIKLILQKDFDHFTDHHGFNMNPKEYIMKNLFSLRGEEWRRTRVKLSPAYTAAKIKMMFALVRRCSDTLRQEVDKYIDSSSVVDVKDFMSRFTIDVIASCAFGIEINSLVNRESAFYRMGIESMKVKMSMMVKLFLLNSFPIFSKVYFFNYVDTAISKFFTGVIRSAVEYREKHNISTYDFLDLLIKLKQNQSILEEGEKTWRSSRCILQCSAHVLGFTVEEITGETFLFFTAGFETSSNTIMFCLYELACDSRIQDKLSLEVEEVLNRYEGGISYQALLEMTYMDQVINETLRRYPPFPYLTRCCTEDYDVPKSSLTIKKGHHITIPVYSLHHDPEHFPEPFTFNPDRFSPENSKDRHPCVFMPFGEGPRMCVGQKFGLMNVKTAVATLVADYQISLTPDTEVPLKLTNNACTTIPFVPLMLVFTRRKTKI
ncbi:LOW QUALITY PROTEIN: probable cytochrome P450 6a13 [Homalodisca vitripennis]|uniref:LOW QUALITY PROTEIN: probable cytochrome P450 6a13 n=1 Tax=Homalodisca vitripennis TaxID=197043 RepID=UPI001EEAE15A|nr:LOW QUALITY PROTEIN: probable cytochrome P450 6a13 [Homalodisca vitripennis]